MKNLFAILVLMSPLLVLLPGLAGGGEGIPDSQIGLSKVSVFDDPAPEAVLWNLSDPGDRPTVPAPFPEAPPVVPHRIDDVLPITFDTNECIDCHAVETKEEGEPTPIPVSHYTDLRYTPDQKGDEVTGARFNCVSCHVTLDDNKEIVENFFGK
jgi:cytochrome c-type protein NapB